MPSPHVYVSFVTTSILTGFDTPLLLISDGHRYFFSWIADPDPLFILLCDPFPDPDPHFVTRSFPDPKFLT